MADKLIESIVPPVQAVIIGGTGDGGVTRHEIITPEGVPNIVVRVISPIVALSVRFAETFLTTLLAITGAGTMTDFIPVKDFYALIQVGSAVSLTAAFIGLAKDIVVILGKLKARYPLFDL